MMSILLSYRLPEFHGGLWWGRRGRHLHSTCQPSTTTSSRSYANLPSALSRISFGVLSASCSSFLFINYSCGLLLYQKFSMDIDIPLLALHNKPNLPPAHLFTPDAPRR